VQRLLLNGTLQAKLKVGPSNDSYEQEADRVADTVMRMPEPEAQQGTTKDREAKTGLGPLAGGITPVVQRQGTQEARKEEDEKRRPGSVGPLSTGTGPAVQRQEARPDRKDEEEKHQGVQRKANGAEITHVGDAALVQRLHSPSGGSPLSGGVRSSFEGRFGYDLSEVRVHDTRQDRADAASLGARAFTYGKHIWLGRGESATDTRLMAHELTHVVQQDAAVRRQPLPATPVAPRIERERPWWERAKAAVGGTVTSVGESIVELGGALKERLLGKVTQWVKDIPGFDLLTVILGKDPITGKPVERNAITLTRGVLGLLGPPGLTMFENLEKSGAITRAFEWLNAEISKLNLTWEAVKELGQAAWKALDGTDLINPAGAIAKLIRIFGSTLDRLVKFAFAAGRKILEFIFEGVLSLAGGFGTRVMAIVRRAGAVFTTIMNDPIGFLGNLIKAIRGGFERFSANILTHLKTALLQWLFGALENAGVTLPQTWDLKGIISLILQILGLSYERSVRPRLVRFIGERAVSFLEGVFDFLSTLVTKGIGAAWEKVLEYAENLMDMVIGGIRDWVASSVVGAAITKLVTMFNPVGAIIQGIMTIYNTVVFFIERAQQIAALAEAVFDSIANIAAGNLSAAIGYVERTMARTLPVIISFLARLIGLGNISDRIKQLITKAQALVDKAIDKVVDFIVKRVRKLIASTDKRTDKQKQLDLQKAVTAAVAAVNRFAGKRVGAPVLRPLLSTIRLRYRLKSLQVVPDGENWAVEGAVNPTSPKKKTLAKIKNTFEEIWPPKHDPESVAPRKVKNKRFTYAPKAREVSVAPLRFRSGSVPGNAQPVGWDRLNDSAPWVRGHLLRGKFGGKGGAGNEWNLVPIPRDVNNPGMYHGHEKPLDEKIREKKGTYYKYQANVSYGHSPREEIGMISDFADKIKVRIWEQKMVNGKSEEIELLPIEYSIRAPKLNELLRSRREG
jgi:hypothetical protein